MSDWGDVVVLLRLLAIEVVVVLAVLVDAFLHGSTPPYLGG